MLGLARGTAPAHAQSSVCASVGIQIDQELALERQAFEARMTVNNSTPGSLEKGTRHAVAGTV